MAKVKKLLQFLFSFNAKAVKRFVAREKFVEFKTVDGVSVVWLGDDFKKNLLDNIEKDVKVAKLKVHKLLKHARNLHEDDEPGIISKLAGKHTTMLAHFHQLLAHKQQTNDLGVVIAYILDGNKILWTVRAYWNADCCGWGIAADSVKSYGLQLDGYQVVSH